MSNNLLPILTHSNLCSPFPLLCILLNPSHSLLALARLRSSGRTLLRLPIRQVSQSPHKSAPDLNRLPTCRQLDAPLIKCNLHSSSTVPNTLIIIYAKCGDLTNVLNVFNKMPRRDHISWTLLSLHFSCSIKCPSKTQMKVNFVK